MQATANAASQDTMLNRAVHTQLGNLERIRELNRRLRDLITRLHCVPSGDAASKINETGGLGVLRDHLSALEIEEQQLTETLDQLIELESLL